MDGKWEGTCWRILVLHNYVCYVNLYTKLLSNDAISSYHPLCAVNPCLLFITNVLLYIYIYIHICPKSCTSRCDILRRITCTSPVRDLPSPPPLLRQLDRLRGRRCHCGGRRREQRGRGELLRARRCHESPGRCLAHELPEVFELVFGWFRGGLVALQKQVITRRESFRNRTWKPNLSASSKLSDSFSGGRSVLKVAPGFWPSCGKAGQDQHRRQNAAACHGFQRPSQPRGGALGFGRLNAAMLGLQKVQRPKHLRLESDHLRCVRLENMSGSGPGSLRSGLCAGARNRQP